MYIYIYIISGGVARMIACRSDQQRSGIGARTAVTPAAATEAATVANRLGVTPLLNHSSQFGLKVLCAPK